MDDTSCHLTGSQDKEGTDPKLAALADNGGQTDTRAIGKDSPAFDNGVSGTLAFGPFGGIQMMQCPSTDQRDLPRPQFAACDSGAYELQPVPPPAAQPAAPVPPAQQVAAVTVKPGNPSLRLAGVRAGCAGATVTVRVRATVPGGVRNVKVTLGSRIIRNTRSKSFTLRIRRSQLRVGHNVLKIVVTDAQNRHVTRRAPLTRCQVRVAPAFTG